MRGRKKESDERKKESTAMRGRKKESDEKKKRNFPRAIPP
jgi:hypothetical protein